MPLGAIRYSTDACLEAINALQAPEGEGKVAKTSPWAARMRYAKIGGAAVAGGAILAVTGPSVPFLHPPSLFHVLPGRHHEADNAASPHWVCDHGQQALQDVSMIANADSAVLS